jgi:hypothetical protein
VAADRPAHAAAKGGLAAAAFAHKAKCFAAANVEAHTIDRADVTHDTLDGAFADRVVLAQVANGEDHVIGGVDPVRGIVRVGIGAHAVTFSKLGRAPDGGA